MLLCGLEAPLLLRHLMDGPFVSSAAFCSLRALVIEDFAGCAAACTSHGPAHAKSNIKQRVCTVRISLFRKLDRRLEPPPGRARHELAASIKAAPTESVPGAECLVGASSPTSINGLEPQGVEAILSTECQVGLNRKLARASWATICCSSGFQ